MQQFRFNNPEYLYLLLLIPAFIAAGLIIDYSLGRKRRSFADDKLMGGLLIANSGIKKSLKHLLRLMALALIIVMVARPQFGSKITEVKRRGIELIICLDVSNSMLATDIQPNRLERSKLAVEKLVDGLSDDRIGMIVFAGEAYIQLPVTSDYVSAKMFLGSINTGMVSKQGTSIGSAIDLATKSFSPVSERSKAIIIITDGEDHGEDPSALVKEAREKGIIIHTIGIGSPDGVPIPLEGAGGIEYLKDQDGKSVITKLNERGLQTIASEGGGNYVRASTGTIGLTEIYASINRMEKSEMEGSIYSEYNEQFQIFAALALLILIIEFFIMERKSNLFEKLFNRQKE